jgi:hypothetical protein
MALREIAAGSVTFDNILDLPKRGVEDAAADAVENDAAAKQKAQEAA